MNETLLALLGTAGFSSLVTWFTTKGRNKADTASIMADAYGKLVDDLREQVKFLGEQYNSQAKEISTMKDREMEFLKIINKHHDEKVALIEKHTNIETELRAQIKTLEAKIEKRINKIENNFQ